MIHLLRYLRDLSHIGVRFYSDYLNAPMTKALIAENISITKPFFGFSDSSWNNDVDHGRSTGCFIIPYMGGVVDHSSNLPEPVALSFAEAEHNIGRIAFMAASHLRMFLADLKALKSLNYLLLQCTSILRVLLRWAKIIRIQSTQDTSCVGIIM